MNILQVNTDDIAGGAAAVAWRLHESFRARGHRSWIAVRVKRSDDPNVIQIDNDSYRGTRARACIRAARLLDPIRGKFRGPGRLHTWLSLALASPRRYARIRNGIEDFDFPATRHLPRLVGAAPDVLHLHNLHGYYFDLTALPRLAQCAPVFMTLHDCWLFSGHCAHSFDCGRWQTGCGECPELDLYPSLLKDATALNWRRKAQIYTNSRLHLATPSRWLMDRVERSMLLPSIREARVIPHGVDLSVFHPSDNRSFRSRLDIPWDSRVLLYVSAGGPANPYKDFPTLRRAVQLAAKAVSGSNVVFIALGEAAATERIDSVEFRYVAFQTSPEILAAYYRAADVYVHAARTETFCLAVTEAMACGTPVVATRVGGIPEQVIDGKTGLLVPPADPDAMAGAIRSLLDNDPLRRECAARAASHAAARFGLAQMADTYLRWYCQIVDQLNRRT